MSAQPYFVEENSGLAAAKCALAGLVLGLVAGLSIRSLAQPEWWIGAVGFAVTLFVCVRSTRKLAARAWSVLWAVAVFLVVCLLAFDLGEVLDGGGWAGVADLGFLVAVMVGYWMPVVAGLLAAVVLLVWPKREIRSARYGR